MCVVQEQLKEIEVESQISYEGFKTTALTSMKLVLSTYKNCVFYFLFLFNLWTG